MATKPSMPHGSKTTSRREGFYATPESDFEWPDPTPIEIPKNTRQIPKVQDLVRQYVQVELSAAADEQGYDTLEEALDVEPD